MREPSALAVSASAPGSPSSGGEVPPDPSRASTAPAPAALLSVASGIAKDAGWMGTRLSRLITQSGVSAYT